MRKVALQVALATLLLVAGGIAFESGRGASQDLASEGLKFGVSCSRSGPLTSTDDLASVSCILKVTGLPDPLDGEVSVTIVAGEETTDAPPDQSAGETLVSSGAPATDAGGLVLVSRRLPRAAPPPLPVSPQVPQEPPQSL